MRLRWAVRMLMLVGATASAQTAAPFMLRISGPGTVGVGQAVQVRVLLQNTSDHAIGVRWPIEEDGLVLSIQGPSGQEPPRKEGVWGGSSGMMSIGPGEVRDDVFRVDSFYDLGQPGKYTLQFKRCIADDRSSNRGFVSSNIITVTVSPETVRQSAPLTLTLTGPKTSVSGADVSLKVLAKNISDQDVFLVTDLDGTIADRNCRTDAVVVLPNGIEFGKNLTQGGPRVIRTISPGAALDAILDKKALGFGGAWTDPITYRFQLICSVPGYPEGDRVVSNAFALDVTPPPVGGPTPFKLKLSGPETVAAGDAVRVDLGETDTSDFGGGIAPEGQLDLLDRFFNSLGYAFSVIDSSGRELLMNTHANVVTGHHDVTSLGAGRTTNTYAVLSDYYDMSQPGVYRVRVSRASNAYPRAGRVFSNVITINVTPTPRR